MSESMIQVVGVVCNEHNPSSTSYISYDNFEELCWAGTDDGRITCFYPNMEKRISFQAHNNKIINIRAEQHGLISVSSQGIRYHSRGGVPKYKFSDNKLNDITNVVYPSSIKGEDLMIISDKSGELAIFDMQHSNIIWRTNTNNDITCMASSRLICTGSKSGCIEFRDPRSLNVERQLVAHTGSVLSIDAKNDLVVTCGVNGFGHRYQLDPVIKVFDIRRMSLLHPLSFVPGPQCVKFFPNFSSTLLVTSPHGQFQVLEALNSRNNDFNYQQVLVAGNINCMDISSSGQMFSFGTMNGMIHSLTDHNDCVVNMYSQMTPNIGVTTSEFKMNQYTPLHVIDLPNYNLPLLSTWQNTNAFKWMKPLPPIDPALVPDLKWHDRIGSAIISDSRFKPNHLNSYKKYTIPSQKFAKNKGNLSNDQNNMMFTMLSPAIFTKPIPRAYAKVKIKIPRLGLYSFDFSPYNRTKFCGLSNFLPNSYCNVAIQMLGMIQPLRNHACNHICNKEMCITCELGFLYRMMDDMKGMTAEPRNFLRVIRQLPQVAALALLDDKFRDGSSDLVLAQRIQNLSRFLLDLLSKEDHNKTNMISKLFAYKTKTCMECSGGQHDIIREDESFSLNLVYPNKRQDISFHKLLHRSLLEESAKRVWCKRCKHYQLTKRTKYTVTLPNILNIHCNITSDVELDLWRTPRKDRSWVPLAFRIKIDPNTLKPKVIPISEAETFEILNKNGYPESKLQKQLLFNDNDKTKINRTHNLNKNKYMEGKEKPTESNNNNNNNNNNNKEEEEDEGVVYFLSAVVAHVLDPPEKDSALSNVNGEHLVAHIRVPDSFGDIENTFDRWIIFNDFVISKSNRYEAIKFDYPWKMPCMLWYTRHNFEKFVSVPKLKNPINKNILYTSSASLSFNKTIHDRPFVPLKSHELLKAGTWVAIDCEFVMVEKEETIQRDNREIIVKPSRLTLGRVSVVRGENNKNTGVPFIDDYIATTEHVVDYLTQWSGIHPGDLDRNISPHHLTTLKEAYIRLRCLVDIGVKFVGHGLQKDFQMINIYVPEHQIIDTSKLFHISGKRYLGLRFLAAHLLNMNIQESTHDSIEDAITALKLARKYEELKKSGKLQETLHELYERGHKKGFRV